MGIASSDLLLWVYLLSGALLITHEIDSAYWREWELFRLPGGLSGFLIIHLPLTFVLLYGAILLDRRVLAGLILALIFGLAGIFAFSIHLFFIRQGRPQFRTATSLCILTAILIAAVVQVALALVLLIPQ